MFLSFSSLSTDYRCSREYRQPRLVGFFGPLFRQRGPTEIADNNGSYYWGRKPSPRCSKIDVLPAEQPSVNGPRARPDHGQCGAKDGLHH
jgi:hypothetical protein